jgi:hypothetical protein
MEEVVEEAAMAAGREGVTTPPEVALEVAIRSPEIQDAEPIRSAPMTEATAMSYRAARGRSCRASDGGQASGGDPSGRAVDGGK